MSERKGKLVSCDRCGREIFLKYIGKGEADGGYTIWDRFENLPDDWMYTSQIGTLCPHCAGLFRIFIYKLMGSKSIAPAWALRTGDGAWMNHVELNDKEKKDE